MSLGQGNPLGPERRREGQVRVRLHVPMSSEPTDAALSFWGYTVNISTGGLCFQQEGTVPPGTGVRLTLRLSRSLILSLLGTVIWAHPLVDGLAYRVGIAFLPPLAAAVIADLAAGRY